ncbi:MAG: hypothetical protein AAGI34_01760 [Pseudomonadota bacterium]
MRRLTAHLALMLLAAAPAAADAAKTAALRECALHLRQRHDVDKLSKVEVADARSSVLMVTGQAIFGEREVAFRCRHQYGTVRTVGFRLDGSNTWLARPPLFQTSATPPTPPEPEVGQDLPTTGVRRIRFDWGESYQPEDGITCYKKRRACYNEDERMNLRWTGREFPSK